MADTYYSNVSLLMHCNGVDATATFTDDSQYAHTMLTQNSPIIKTDNLKFGTASLLGSGTSAGDNVYIDHVSIDTGTNDFTFEFWVKLDATAPQARSLVATIKEVASSEGSFFLGTHASDAVGSSRLTLDFFDGSGGFVSISTNSAISTAVFVAIAIVRSGDTAALYVDGVKQTSTADITGYSLSSSTLSLCGRVGTSDTSFLGNLDEIRYTKGVARYTASYTPATSEFDAFAPAFTEIEYIGRRKIIEPLKINQNAMLHNLGV